MQCVTLHKSLFLTSALAALLVFHSSPARAVDSLATPTGESVVGGAATFSRPVTGQLNITQTTDRTVINWGSFDIGHDATTQFFQPSATALAVNRVTGAHADPTQILGTLNANGRVMILDRNGVLFGNDAKVNVGGIVAAAGDVSTSKVMAGGSTVGIQNIAPDATVENRGAISVADAGLAAFVAPTVRNSGVITANLGKVALASGSKVTVDLYGDNLVSVALNSTLTHALLDNSGNITAAGGSVQMTTHAAAGVVNDVINNSGIVNVSSVSVQGGKIILSGNARVKNSGTFDAHGDVAGGKIKVTGRSIESTGTMNADSSAGTGGRIDFVAVNAAHVGGLVTAGGAATGGTIKLIAHDVYVGATGKIAADASAPGGTGGHVELDPTHNAYVDGILEANGDAAGGVVQINAHDIALGAASQALANGAAGHGGNVDLFATHLLTADGHVSASGLDDNFGGEVDAKGRDISVGGSITASGSAGFGGTVNLFAIDDVTVGGSVDTTGALGGGKIKLTGHDLTVPGLLDARSISSGYSGIVELFASNAVDIAGTLDTSGPDGGGFIKITGHDITLEQPGRINAQLLGPSGRQGRVFMLASHDVNIDGIVNTDGALGGVIKATGHDITLANGGRLFAEGSTTGDGGDVTLTAQHNVQVDGEIKTSGMTGSNVSLKGYNVGVGTTADILARGSNTGGSITLSALRNASLEGLAQVDGAYGGGTFSISGQNVNVASLINANAGVNGNGGTVSLSGAVSNDFSGIITARGGPSGGNGGTVTIASPNTITGFVDVSAPAGTAGTYTH